nr:NAD-glutamate dehydrogenase domain-containing protein [Burkholderia sp. Ac-20365]
MAHWRFAQRFTTGAYVVRVYNPDPERDGYRSDGTVVEIVADDMPFLLDSVTAAINQLELALRAPAHPVFRVWRGSSREIVRMDVVQNRSGDGRSSIEAFIRFEVDRCDEKSELVKLRLCIVRVLQDVRAAVEDWLKIVSLARASVGRLRTMNESRDGIEARAFLEWMIADHFTFLGYGDYDLFGTDGALTLRGRPESGAGILRETLRPSGKDSTFALSREAVAIFEDKAPIFLTKSTERSTVLRPAYLDYVSVKRLDMDGAVIGERRFVGLYTSTAYMVPPFEIPIVRRKCATIVQRVGKWASEEWLRAFFERLPREELFQANTAALVRLTLRILRLDRYPSTRAFVGRDPFNRFISCLVFVPRDAFNSKLRRHIGRMLMKAFNGASVEIRPYLSDEWPLAQLYIVVHAGEGGMPHRNMREVERAIERTVQRIAKGERLTKAEPERMPEDGTKRLHKENGAKVVVISERIEPQELRALLEKHDSPYADYICTTGLGVALKTDPCSTLDDFVQHLASIPTMEIELAWSLETIAAPDLFPSVGVVGVFGSGAIRSIGKVIHSSARGVHIEISDGLELLDPDADMDESAYNGNLESQVIIVGVEVG